MPIIGKIKIGYVILLVDQSFPNFSFTHKLSKSTSQVKKNTILIQFIIKQLCVHILQLLTTFPRRLFFQIFRMHNINDNIGKKFKITFFVLLEVDHWLQKKKFFDLTYPLQIWQNVCT
jgi:hypothetical protein